MTSLKTNMNRLLVIALGLWVGTGALEASAAVVDGDRAAPTFEEPRDDARIARRRARRGKNRSPRTEAPKRKDDPAPASTAPAVENATRSGPTRIEFDERLLQGQTNKANAIYLFQRRESALRSLVKKRVHFHEEIDESLE